METVESLKDTLNTLRSAYIALAEQRNQLSYENTQLRAKVETLRSMLEAAEVALREHKDEGTLPLVHSTLLDTQL